MNGYDENLFVLRVSLYWDQSYTVESAFCLDVGGLMITVMMMMRKKMTSGRVDRGSKDYSCSEA